MSISRRPGAADFLTSKPQFPVQVSRKALILVFSYFNYLLFAKSGRALLREPLPLRQRQRALRHLPKVHLKPGEEVWIRRVAPEETGSLDQRKNKC